jgi:glycosyltransferase involved in cell wall biosynthesis
VNGPEQAHARSGKISCIMASRGRAYPARVAIDCYQRQRYSDRELIVISARPDAEVAELILELGDPSIRFIAAPNIERVGEMRNAAIEAATGDLISVWDDDDLSHPMRLEWQYSAMTAMDADACVLARVLLWWPQRRRLAVSIRRVWENTLLARRGAMPAYSKQVRGSDTEVMRALVAKSAQITMLDTPDAYLYIAHGGNLWGDDHFELLFANAIEIAAAEYDEMIERLSHSHQINDYLGGLAAPMPRQATGTPPVTATTAPDI